VGARNLPLLSAVEQVDTRYLQTLLGYNARRAALTIIEGFLERMAEFELRPVDFSVMSVIHHNPGVTSRQLCLHSIFCRPTWSAWCRRSRRAD